MYWLPDLANLAIIPVILLAPLVVVYVRKRRKPALEDSSVLLSYYTEGSDLMHVYKKDLEDNASYDYIVASSEFDEATGICRVQLPFTARMRLLAIPTTEMAQLKPAGKSSIMIPVVLEGDFPNTFSLYANKGQEMEARYVLDPAAMAFVVDFCSKYSWELINDELFFVTHRPDLTTDIIQKFIDEIRPAVEISNSTVNPLMKPQFKNMTPLHLKCPICEVEMTRSTHWYECPTGHGRLIAGTQLMAVAQKQIEAPQDNAEPRTHGDLTCPFCKHTMQAIAYRDHSPIIDTCTHCPYRWLDAKELFSITM